MTGVYIISTLKIAMIYRRLTIKSPLLTPLLAKMGYLLSTTVYRGQTPPTLLSTLSVTRGQIKIGGHPSRVGGLAI